MNGSVPDIHQILEYRADTAIVRMLPVGLALCFLGLLGLALLDADRPSGRDFAELILAIGICLTAGIGIIGLALWKRFNRSRPVFVLSPAGVHYRIPWVKEFVVPWREIRGVDAIDITSSNWSIRRPGTITFSDVTAVLVSKEFYDAYIHVSSLFLRGPGWGNVFVPKDALVQMALHHELVSVEPRALREAVKARWQAFHDQPVKPRGASMLAATRGWKRAIRRNDVAARAGPGIAMGDNPKTMSAWQTVQIIVPLIGIAIVLSNLLGLWATQGQITARKERMKWEQEDKRRQEERKKFDEEAKKRDQRFQEMFRRF